jgi:pyruvate dehydrogenase E1 component alpha subunit
MGVLSIFGDGATSTGDFHEALNFAAVWKAPAIFYVQNNQWAISVPRAKQTASATIAEKAFAYGIEGVQVDGNDVMAVYAAVKMAADKARADDGPTLIEGLTYRLGAHTTADDPKRYRSDDEVEAWRQKDPLLRLGSYLKKIGRLDDGKIDEMEKAAKKVAQDAFREAENHAAPTIEDTYRYTYKVMPPILEHQLQERKALDAQVAAAAAGRQA